MNKWTTALQEALNDTCEKVPKGWLTATQISTLMGVGLSQTRSNLRLLIKSGKCDVKDYRAKCGKRICPTPFYKLK